MSAEHFRVLLAENGFTETGITLRSLCAETGRALELMLVSNKDGLAQTLNAYSPHVALLDLSLLQPSPAVAVGMLHQSAPHIPLIVVAAETDRESAAQCLTAGAKDFILQGFMDARTLERALHAAIAAPRPLVVTEATRDPLTGLVDHAGFLYEARACLAMRPLSAAPLLVWVCLQNFDKLNTLVGPSVTESILKKIAILLRKSVRSSDLVAYLGSGRFLLFIFDITEAGESSVRHRISERLLDSSEAELSLSIVPQFLQAGSVDDSLACAAAEAASPSMSLSCVI